MKTCFVTLIPQGKKRSPFFPENILLMMIHHTAKCAVRNIYKNVSSITKCFPEEWRSEVFLWA